MNPAGAWSFAGRRPAQALQSRFPVRKTQTGWEEGGFVHTLISFRASSERLERGWHLHLWLPTVFPQGKREHGRPVALRSSWGCAVTCSRTTHTRAHTGPTLPYASYAYTVLVGLMDWLEGRLSEARVAESSSRVLKLKDLMLTTNMLPNLLASLVDDSEDPAAL